MKLLFPLITLRMTRALCPIAIFFFVAQPPATQAAAPSEQAPSKTWRFVVSGDSRNCGDVIMPAIAAGAKASGAAFYWHLGDFRALFKVDEDFAHEPAYRSNPISKADYQKLAWPDFIDNQVLPFDPIPVFLGIGNHEMIDHDAKRADYIATFHKWLTAPEIVNQRVADKDSDSSPKSYYHWTRAGIDFINLDNASDEQFDSIQMAWFEKILTRDDSDAAIRTVVVGMHKALPDSISYSHSMSESPQVVSIESGRQVYRDLLKAQNEFHKNVYLLASHSHFYMDGTFNTDFWNKNGGVLPAWIIGTAGAERYPLPNDWRRARAAIQGTYGYLLATVNPDDGSVLPDGAIRFEFHLVNKSDIPAAVRQRFTPQLVDFCFDENMRKGEP